MGVVMQPHGHPFGNTGASRLLIHFYHTRPQAVEFHEHLFFKDLCAQIFSEEAILLAGGPRNNKSALTRQLTLDPVSKIKRALMILTNESA